MCSWHAIRVLPRNATAQPQARATPEYFGQGRIGRLWRDEAIPESSPKKDWAWYCTIEDYMPFPATVPAKIDGAFLERIAKNHWSVGVRPLPQDVYERILDLAGISHSSERDIVPIPDLAYVRITETDTNLLLPRKATFVNGPPDTPAARYSRNAAPIGRRAEELVNQYITRNAEVLDARKIRWIADEGSTPGWDLQYENQEGNLIAVEVKGTAGPQFGSIDITAGEWNAAQAMRDRYWLYLVANCGTTQPVLQRIRNPAQLLECGAAQLVPVVYRFTSVANTT